MQKIRPGPRLIDPFRNEFVFYGEGLLAREQGTEENIWSEEG
jgi:hypothetical protein